MCGGVDLRISSLIALARLLDLELLVAPKQSVPAIKSIIRSGQGAYHNGPNHNGINDVAEPIPPAYQLEKDDD